MRLLSRSEVLARIGIPRSTWYWLRERGEFPAPLKVAGMHGVCWRASDVDAWLRERGLWPPAARDT